LLAFLDGLLQMTPAAPTKDPNEARQQMVGNRTAAPQSPEPLNGNLGLLLTLLEAELRAADGGSTARWQMARIRELPEIQILAEQLGLCRPGELSAATVRAIAARLCVRYSVNQQQAYQLPLPRVIDWLREQVDRQSGSKSEKDGVMPDARNVFV